MDFSELRRLSNQFVNEMDDWKAVAVQQNKKILVDMNRSQMLAGKRADGKPIRPEYTEKYAMKKGFSTPNLYMTGLFQDGIDMTVEDTEVLFESSIDYAKYLVKRYTDKIYGIAPDNRKRAGKINGDTLIKLYVKWLGL